MDSTTTTAAIGVGAALIIGGALLSIQPDKALIEEVLKVQQATDTATYFAQIDANGVVQRVIVADQAFIDSGVVGDPSKWIQTWQHGENRKNYASKGDAFNKTSNAFIKGRNTASTSVFDVQKAQWKSPDIIQDMTASTTKIW